MTLGKTGIGWGWYLALWTCGAWAGYAGAAPAEAPARQAGQNNVAAPAVIAAPSEKQAATPPDPVKPVIVKPDEVVRDPAPAKPPAPVKPDPRLVAEVDQLMGQLTADDWHVRHAAQQRMEKLPVEALPLVAERYRQSTDAELRWRVKEYAHQVFRNRLLERYIHTNPQPGFLGVTHQPTAIAQKQGILITNVIPDSSAAKAGLKSGDIILAVAGQTIGDNDPSGQFGRLIQSRRPGEQVAIKVVRGGRTMTVTATLGRYPRNTGHFVQPMHSPRHIDQLEKLWWEQAFLQGRVDLPAPLVQQFRDTVAKQSVSPQGTVVRQIVHPDGSVTIIQRLPSGQLQVINR